MDLTLLKPGDRIRTRDGATAEILKPTEDGKWILVRYIEASEDPAIVGTEDLCAEAEVTEVLGSAEGARR